MRFLEAFLVVIGLTSVLLGLLLGCAALIRARVEPRPVTGGALLGAVQYNAVGAAFLSYVVASSREVLIAAAVAVCAGVALHGLGVRHG
jgi:uncharacterized membrane protein